jgi:hypothetical protein
MLTRVIILTQGLRAEGRNMELPKHWEGWFPLGGLAFILLEIGLSVGGYQNRVLGIILVVVAVILFLFPLLLKLMKWLLQFLIYLYGQFCAASPRLSLVIAAIVGAILFPSVLFFIGQAYLQSKASPPPPVAVAPPTENKSAPGIAATSPPVIRTMPTRRPMSPEEMAGAPYGYWIHDNKGDVHIEGRIY